MKQDQAAPRLALQREELPKYAHAQGWEYRVFDEGIVSGEDESRRPVYQQFLAAISTRSCTHILALDFQRYSRRASTFARLTELCAENNILICVPGQHLDPRDAVQGFITQIQAATSALEYRQIRQRMAQGRTKARELGRWLGGSRPPWPYKYSATHSLEIDETARDKFERIITELRAGESCASIAKRHELSIKLITKMTRRPRLLFLMGRREIRRDGLIELVPCDWPALIEYDPALIREMADRPDRLKNKTWYNLSPQLLTGLGLTFCGHCGKSLKTHKITHHNPGRTVTSWNYYRCYHDFNRCPTRRLRRCSVVDELVLNDVSKKLADIKSFRANWNKTREKAEAERGQKIKTIESMLTDLLARKTRLIEAIEKGAIELHEAHGRLTELKYEIAKQETIRSHLDERVATLPFEKLAKIDISVLDLAGKKDLLRSILERIKYYEDRMVISYRFLDSHGEPLKSEIYFA